jgi:putative intracellular protease/amidase
MPVRAAVVVRPGYHELQLWYPVMRLREAGVTVLLAAEERKEYLGAVEYPAIPDVTFADLAADPVGIVILPGTVRRPETEAGAEAEAGTEAGASGLGELVKRAEVVVALGDGAELAGETAGLLLAGGTADDLPRLMELLIGHLAEIAEKEAS